MAVRKSNRLSLQQVGPIKAADVVFGDLTVIVGPQATGPGELDEVGAHHLLQLADGLVSDKP